MITSTDFKIRFPEFVSVADAKINLLIDEAYLSIGANYGKFQDTAVLYFVAHNLVIETNGLNAMSATISSHTILLGSCLLELEALLLWITTPRAYFGLMRK